MRQTGTVKFFNQEKGYGFISPADGSKDVFVHITAVQRSGIPELNEGMKVSFEIQPGQVAALNDWSLTFRTDAPTYSEMEVSGLGGTIADVDVTFTITHPNDEDLDVYLIGPTGTRVELATDVGEPGTTSP